MRGDSLRDLYAKTLALLGLGVLAGAGALVDFWPAGVQLIPVSSALQVPEVADEARVVPLAARETGLPPAVQMIANVAPVPVVASRVADAVEARPAVFDVAPATVALNATLATLIDAPLTTQTVIALSDPATPVIDEPQVAIVAMATETEVDETLAPGFEPWTTLQPSLASVQTSDDPGFLSGALKKTQSLVRTSARTGASIVDAVRIGLGAVRRALPNGRDQSFRFGV